MQHDYEWAETAGTALTILERDTEVRTAPYTYGTHHPICFGQYTAKPHPALPVIANIDAARVFPASLTFEVDDGTAGKYPLCGSLQLRKARGVAERELPTPGEAVRSGMQRANGSSGTNGAAWKRSVPDPVTTLLRSHASNTNNGSRIRVPMDRRLVRGRTVCQAGRGSGSTQELR